MNLYVAVALLVVAPCCLGEGQSCQGQTDCASDECCTYFAPFRGRRQDSGVCKKRGTLNDKCFTENHFQTEGRYANICPCASGFGCKSMGFVEVPFGEVGECRPHANDVRRALRCNTGADCPDDHCCQSLAQLDGRRQILSQGVCKPLGKAGSSCHVRYQAGKPKDMVYSCPCSQGLHCQGSGFFDIPLGETGTCEPATKGRREEVESRETQCSTGADCPPDQCCESLFKPIGRRQLISRAQGVCRPMGTVGSHCYANSVSGKPDHMTISCPCSAGLHCQGSGLFEVPLGEVGTCEPATKGRREEVESRETQCSTGADCPPDQCCESLFKAIGRRQLISRAQGVCRPMGTVGSQCYANSVSGKPDHMTMSCPCSAGLHCKGSGLFEVPLGEVGTCQAAATTRQAVQSRETHCTSGADCPAHQCCATHVTGHNGSVCQHMGTVGSPCLTTVTPGKHDHVEQSHCPCSAHLQCVHQFIFTLPTPLHTGKCQAAATTRQAVQSRETHCTSGADCPADQCCASQGTTHVGQGVCKPMGTVGSACLTTTKPGKHNGVELLQCPCSAHLHCVHHSLGLLAPDIPILGQCKQPVEDESDDVSCQSGADCPSDQCCVNLDRPIGRRQLRNSKVCRPMGTSGSSCFAKSTPGKPDHVVYACPCSTGFHCKPNGIFDVPLGELGNCVADSH